MNIRELISSGKLESYVAGALDQEEMNEIALIASQNPELAEEIRKIESAILQYYAEQGTPMSKQMMDSNLEVILNKKLRTPELKGVDRGEKTSKLLFLSKWAAAALVCGLIIATAFAAILWNQNVQLKKESETYRNRFEMVKSILTKRSELRPVSGNTVPEGYLVLYWNPQTHQVLLADANLPALPQDKQYQLWALFEDSQIDLGVFELQKGHSTAKFMKEIEKAQGFAVTIEPRGGSKTPTLSNLTVMSKL